MLLAVALCSAAAVVRCSGHEHEHDHGTHTDHRKSMYTQENNEAAADDHDHDHHDHAHDDTAPDDPPVDHAHDHKAHDHDHSHDHAGHGKAAPVLNMETWLKAIGATLFISIVPIFMLYFIPIDASNPEHQGFLKVLLAFAAGGLLGDAFLHLLPHAMHPHSHGEDGGHDHAHSHAHSHGEEEGHDHTAELAVGLWVLGGIVSFFMLEKWVRSIKGGGHSHSHGAPHAPAEEKKSDGAGKGDSKGKGDGKGKGKEPAEPEIKVTAYLNLAADFTHNFTDGLAIGASFLVDERLAIITVFTILLHEVPHEIGDFAILIQSGYSKTRAMQLQFSTAIGAMAGTVCGLLSQNFGEATQWILPFTAGGFVYIATVSVLPELLEDTTFWQSIKELVALAAGVAIMVIIVFLE